jgi:UDP-sugar transporter A1/2/3
MGASTLAGIPLKWISLTTLIIQNSLLVILMKYSRAFPSSDGLPYLASTAVVLSELLKLAICILVYSRELAAKNVFSTSRVFYLSNHL